MWKYVRKIMPMRQKHSPLASQYRRKYYRTVRLEANKFEDTETRESIPHLDV